MAVDIETPSFHARRHGPTGAERRRALRVFLAFSGLAIFFAFDARAGSALEIKADSPGVAMENAEPRPVAPLSSPASQPPFPYAARWLVAQSAPSPRAAGDNDNVAPSNVFSARLPALAFPANRRTGIGNPAPNTVSTIIDGIEHDRVTPEGFKLTGISAPMLAGDLRYASDQNAGSSHEVGGNGALMQFSDDPSSALFLFYKSRSRIKGESKAVHSNDDIGELDFEPDGGAGPVKSAFINAIVDQGPITGDSVPGMLRFWTMPAGGKWPLERMRILANGNIGVNQRVPSSRFDVVGDARIQTELPGMGLTIHQANSAAGGAEIRTSTGFNSSQPIYAFWGDSGAGLGNPARGVGSFVAGGEEVGRFSAAGLSAKTFIAAGAPPKILSSCPIGSRVGGAAGSFTAAEKCSSGTLVLRFDSEAPNGFHCTFNDETTHANTSSIYVVGHERSQVTVKAAMAKGDVITYACMAF